MGSKSMAMTERLRELIRDGAVFAAGVYDPLSARMAELAGFRALHLTGFGVEATQIGAPDMGIMSATELVTHASRITDAVDVPILSDIDTGFGGPNNIARTIRSMEKAGVAGVHMEDQAFPKRCPILEGRVIVSRDHGIGRIKAAVDARKDPSFVIVARTDGDALSIDEAIERANLYLEAGADMAMPSFMNVDGRSYGSLTPDEQMALFRRLTAGIHGKVMSLGVRPPVGFTAHDMFEAGFTFVMFPSAGVCATANALAQLFKTMLDTGTDAPYFQRTPGEYNDPMALMKALRLDHYVDVDRRFTPPEA
jgi:2-methylisocitrate lyase-like PEP mutase family enzyme